MAIAVSALKAEFFSSVYSGVYSAARTAGDLGRLTFLLNTVAAVEASNTITVGTVRALNLQQCVVVAEYSSLTQVQRDLWQSILTAGVQGMSVSNALIRSQIAGIWSAGTTTRANLQALQSRPCSRAEFLSGEGAHADANNIYVALTQ